MEHGAGVVGMSPNMGGGNGGLGSLMGVRDPDESQREASAKPGTRRGSPVAFPGPGAPTRRSLVATSKTPRLDRLRSAPLCPFSMFLRIASWPDTSLKYLFRMRECLGGSTEVPRGTSSQPKQRRPLTLPASATTPASLDHDTGPRPPRGCGQTCEKRTRRTVAEPQ
jgi:hypothetical protein